MEHFFDNDDQAAFKVSSSRLRQRNDLLFMLRQQIGFGQSLDQRRPSLVSM
jgi:hypothetical protein